MSSKDKTNQNSWCTFTNNKSPTTKL